LIVKCLIKRSEYHDSVSLMLAAREIARLEGIGDAAVVMGTDANKSLLNEAGLLTPEAEATSPNDLIIAVSGEAGALEKALIEAEKILSKKQGAETGGGMFRSKTLRSAARSNPGANLAVISVAGRYAADEAWEALHQGLHVLLFSDNVSLEDEIALKHYAVDHGLLLMGPGAGTAVINGVALGFANVLPPGPVGIVSAAGTGLQEVSTLLAKHGVGITQGIGTGGRDLKEEVGGLMMLAGLQALQEDPQTKLIILISKPPAPGVAARVLEQVTASAKPAVVCFLGGNQETLRVSKNLRVCVTKTLEEAALRATRYINTGAWQSDPPAESSRPLLLQPRLKPGQRYLRGLFSGGTLCYEAQAIWRELLAEPVFSNAPLDEAHRLPDSLHSQGHCAVDLGEEEFTVGRPHPMIDNDLRIRRLLGEAGDPQTAVIMLDVVLGYGAHPDPAGELAPVIRQARQAAREAGGELPVVASVTGTEADPQRLSRQVQALTEAGVVVCSSNAAAARLVAQISGFV
jgi:FdrA protein